MRLQFDSRRVQNTRDQDKFRRAWVGATRCASLAALAISLGFSPLQAKVEASQTAQTLLQVKKIYVGSLGDKQGATELRDRLIQRLKKTHVFEIVATPGEADAIITGEGKVWLKYYMRANPKPSPWNREPVYDGYLSLELKGKDDKTLWSCRTTPGKWVWNSVTQDIANRAGKKLLAAVQPHARPQH
jgi:hypothetical protein